MILSSRAISCIIRHGTTGVISQLTTLNKAPKLNDKLYIPTSCISKRSFFLSPSSLSEPKPEVENVASINSSQCLAPHVDDKFSYAFGRSTKELKNYTFGQQLKTMATSEPHSTVIVFYDEGVSKSYKQLNDDINKLVNGLVHKLELKRGDVVGIYSYNVYQYIVAQFACNKLGLAVNHFNPSYKAHELCNVLSKSDIKVLFMPGKNSRQSSMNDQWGVICDDLVLKLQKEGKLPNFKQIVLFDGESDERLKLENIKIDRWRSVLGSDSMLSPESEAAISEVCTDDIYGVYYTSGTTGVPKGAAVTQFTVLNNCALAVERLYKNRGPNLREMRGNVCCPLPLFHQFSGVVGILNPLICSGSFVSPGIKYNIQAVLESIMRFKCNALYATPTILIDFLDLLKKNQLDTRTLPLRTILISGSMVPPELVYRAHKELKCLEEVKTAYGCSEIGVIASIQLTWEDPQTKPYTSGVPLDFTEMRVVDTNTGLTTKLGEVGELQTRGYNLMTGYYNDRDKTNKVITESRWYKTGDLATIDGVGNVRIVGRLKDLIIKGGENIYPAEVESVLHHFKGVVVAQVFGVPDKRYVEEVCAWVQMDKKPAGPEEEEKLKENIREFCRSKLTYNKVPKHIIFVQEFPQTPTKKMKRFAMRDETIKLLNLEDI